MNDRIELYRRLAGDKAAAPAPMRLVDYVAVYGTGRELRADTLRQYAIAAERLEAWAGGPVMLADLTELLVSAWLRDYGATVKPATARSKRNQVVALWRAAADEYRCCPPARRIRAAKVPWQPRECWTIDEVRRLVQAAALLPRRTPCGMSRAEWFDLAVRVAWDTGLRWGDQTRLRADEIRDDGTFVVAQSKTRRPVCGRLSPSTMAALRASLRQYPRDLVTPWTASRETFGAQVRRLVARAGVRPGTWKWLRRGSATDVESQAPNKGMAARHLGHAPGSKVAELHYLSPAVVAANVPIVSPREIGAAGFDLELDAAVLPIAGGPVENPAA
jgi:integrase